MTKPRIGITTYGRNEINQYNIPAGYIESVRRANAYAYLLPPGETDIAGWLGQLDGIIFSGGGDITPKHYGGEHHESIMLLDEERDETEIIIAKECLEREIPTFAICRGMQLINVVCGGTLHQHLPEEYGGHVLHLLPDRKPNAHETILKSESKLADIIGQKSFTAASLHHQAVKDLAPGFTVAATAPDNVVEAIENPNWPWLIAVQWHPELTAADDPLQQSLFDYFVKHL